MLKNFIVKTVRSLTAIRKSDTYKKLFPTSSLCSTSSGENAEEKKLTNLLKSKFPQASSIDVQDISGGCGAMYEVWVESNEFKGLSHVKQHKLITQALKEEIKDMHGLRISTSIPEES